VVGVRSCCLQRGYQSCADCTEFSDVKDCKKYKQLDSPAVRPDFRSNRPACIALIREQGYPVFAADMAARKGRACRASPAWPTWRMDCRSRIRDKRSP